MLRGILAVAWFVALTAALGGSACLVSLLRPRSDVSMRLGRLWSASMLWAVGARVSYEGLEHTRTRLPCIFIANHESNVDIWALVRVLPLQARFVAKRSLFRIPIMGWAMYAGGFVPIDRADRERAIRSLELAARKIRAGRPVVLFPEGTRGRGGELQPFKKGPFHLAIAAGVPLVPAVIVGSGRVMPARSLCVRPGPVRVRFLPPLEVASYGPDDHRRLLERVRSLMQEALDGEPSAPSPPLLSEGAE
jgi:1-acyl-sn-glycerol-3-phosphate acyltransferase